MDCHLAQVVQPSQGKKKQPPMPTCLVCNKPLNGCIILPHEEVKKGFSFAFNWNAKLTKNQLERGFVDKAYSMYFNSSFEYKLGAHIHVDNFSIHPGCSAGIHGFQEGMGGTGIARAIAYGSTSSIPSYKNPFYLPDVTQPKKKSSHSKHVTIKTEQQATSSCSTQHAPSSSSSSTVAAPQLLPSCKSAERVEIDENIVSSIESTQVADLLMAQRINPSSSVTENATDKLQIYPSLSEFSEHMPDYLVQHLSHAPIALQFDAPSYDPPSYNEVVNYLLSIKQHAPFAPGVTNDDLIKWNNATETRMTGDLNLTRPFDLSHELTIIPFTPSTPAPNVDEKLDFVFPSVPTHPPMATKLAADDAFEQLFPSIPSHSKLRVKPNEEQSETLPAS